MPPSKAFASKTDLVLTSPAIDNLARLINSFAVSSVLTWLARRVDISSAYIDPARTEIKSRERADERGEIR